VIEQANAEEFEMSGPTVLMMTHDLEEKLKREKAQ